MSIRFRLRSVLVAVAVVCFVLRWCLGPVVSPAVLRRLNAGMTSDEVVEVLGEPVDRGERWWYYERPFNPGWLTVWFDGDEKYAGYSEERAFP